MDRLSPDPPGSGAPPLVYLDHAATSPVRPEVVEAMARFNTSNFGNPSGAHRIARTARTALDDARHVIAELLGAHDGEVIFTSGGTESDNLAVLGVLGARVESGRGGGALVYSAIEHAAVLEPCRAAAKMTTTLMGGTTFELREVPVGVDGLVDIEHLDVLLDHEVALVSVMAANSEVGTIQPLHEVAASARRYAPTAVLHTDAVQAISALEVAELAAGFDLISLSAHKLGGPKGTGALVVRQGVALRPLLYGGGQERERRSGTPDVAGAVGLATALTIVDRNRSSESARVAQLRNRLADGLIKANRGVTETVGRADALPGHCHLLVDGVDHEELLVLLDAAGICASAGSACASGALEPSHVLRAMGIAPERAKGSVRFTLGWSTTSAEIDRALAVIPGIIDRLRG